MDLALEARAGDVDPAVAQNVELPASTQPAVYICRRRDFDEQSTVASN
jgi:hypothetical protein